MSERPAIVIDLRSLTIGVALAAICLSIVALGLRLGRVSASESVERPAVYLISVTYMSLPDEDVYLVRYTVNGLAQAIDIPADHKPEEFIAHLAQVGNLEGWEAGR